MYFAIVRKYVEIGCEGSRYLFSVLEQKYIKRFELRRNFKREKILEERIVMM